MVTPVDADALMVESGYDHEETKFLVNGFRNGFELNYTGNWKVKLRAPNLRFDEIGDDIDLWNKVMGEIKLGRYAGPYENIPYEYYIQSPIGLVPKDNGASTRLIFHLSYPRYCRISVNDNIPNEVCSVQYPDFSKAVQLCLGEGRNCHISCSDMSVVFCNLRLAKKEFCLLIMKGRSPLDGRTYYFVGKCLSFGCAISCTLFQRFSNCVAHIVRFET